MDNIIEGTFAKLRSGDWGVRVIGDQPKAGDPIDVRRKDGQVTRKTVVRRVWTGRDRGRRVGLYVIEDYNELREAIAQEEQGLDEYIELRRLQDEVARQATRIQGLELALRFVLDTERYADPSFLPERVRVVVCSALGIEPTTRENIEAWLDAYGGAVDEISFTGADYSQLEMRIMASLSGDAELIRRCADADESDKYNPDRDRLFEHPDPHANVDIEGDLGADFDF